MSNRRVKDIAHDEDYLDDFDSDYDEEENEQELSPEDREQMRQCTIKVREALGSQYPASDKEIQDALWHYYYDVAKSVAYVKNTKKQIQAKTSKPETKFDKAATSAAQFGAVKPKKQAQDNQKQANGTSIANTIPTTEEPIRKSKNVNVIAEYEKSNQKKRASFVVVGHVDHGKSTLMGRLLLDLKVIDQRSIDKLRKEADIIGKSSFALAWVMDETSEERASGITVDFATNHFETEKTRFTILDAPGHQDFVPNMIAGASQADFAVLVIDASTNSFESGLKGQTKEHALLVRSMGVQRLIVVVNKMDNVAWSQERFEEINKQMSTFLVSVGFQAKTITFVPCAGLTGENVVTPLDQSVASWYRGGTLVEALETTDSNKRALESPLRLTISDVFRANAAPSLTGRIDTGSLQAGEQIMVMPSGEKAFIKAMEVDKDTADWAVAGQIVTLHITDIDPAHLRTGDIVCSPSKPIQNLKSFVTKILAFEHVMPMLVDVHRGPLHAPARITKLLATLDKSSGEVDKRRPRVIQPGAAARVSIDLDSPTPLEKGIRVVLRAEGKTIAAGLVE